MLHLEIINQSFKAKNDRKHLNELQALFNFFRAQKKWQSLKGTINLILTDNATIQKLNSQYRQKNQPTDVLSFPYFDLQEIESNQMEDLVIGEIFIARERAQEDALVLEIAFQAELNKLFIHGILHILGYDHIADNDFLAMEKMENFLLKSFQEEQILE